MLKKFLSLAIVFVLIVAHIPMVNIQANVCMYTQIAMFSGFRDITVRGQFTYEYRSDPGENATVEVRALAYLPVRVIVSAIPEDVRHLNFDDLPIRTRA